MFRLFAKKLPLQTRQGILDALLPSLDFGEAILTDKSIQKVYPKVTDRIASSQRVELLSLFAAELPQGMLSNLREAPPNRRPFFVETAILAVARGSTNHLLLIALLFTKYMMEIELMLQIRDKYPRDNDLWEKVDVAGQLLAAAYSEATGSSLITASKLSPDFVYAYAPGGRFAA